MVLESKKKASVIAENALHNKDTGSANVQIALLTERINGLTEHFKSNKKDNHSRYGLLKLVNQRRKLLDYLKREDEQEYAKLITKLNLRK